MTITQIKNFAKPIGGILLFLLFIGFYFFFTDTSTLEVVTVPSGADITINGTPSGKKSPMKVSGFRKGDTVTILAALPNYRQQMRELMVQNKTERVIILLVKKDSTTSSPPEPPPPSVNPTFTQKLQTQPYRQQLPYWTANYKIDYIHSTNTFLITILKANTITAEQKARYQEDAKNWLKTNGADLTNANIQFAIQSQ